MFALFKLIFCVPSKLTPAIVLAFRRAVAVSALPAISIPAGFGNLASGTVPDKRSLAFKSVSYTHLTLPTTPFV